MNEYQGELHLEVTGKDLTGLENESGGHRIQRVPPTERKGRVHTSTVTVAIIENAEKIDSSIPEKDLKIEWYSGTGAGGQHRNKKQNSCRITHIPTGTVVTAQSRSRENSLSEAMTIIQETFNKLQSSCYNSNIAADRKIQVGSGMRGDKIRTYQFTNDLVVDHQTGKRMILSKYMRGFISELWD